MNITSGTAGRRSTALIHKWNNNLTVRYDGLIPPRPQICQNMHDLGEISLTCLTKYAKFFGELVKLGQIIKLNARYLGNKTKLRMSFRNYFNY